MQNDLEALVQSCYCTNCNRSQSRRAHGFLPISGENSIGSSFRTTTIVLRTTSIKVHNNLNLQNSNNKENVTNTFERQLSRSNDHDDLDHEID